jgi:hypothetical protein
MAVYGGHAGNATFTAGYTVERAVRMTLGNREADSMAIVSKAPNGRNSTHIAIQTDNFTVHVIEYHEGGLSLTYETGRFE